MSENSSELPSRLIGEPITREDGISVKATQGQAFVFIETSLSGAQYSISQVELIGGGDFQAGVNRLMLNYYRAPIQDLLGGTQRLLQNELEQKID